jgi:amino acid adenylation domain-containing protein
MIASSPHQKGQGRAISEAYPLSPLQHVILVQSLDPQPPGVGIEQAFFELPGKIDVPAFERAWNKVIARHAILRTSFHWLTDGEPQQIVQRLAPLQLRQLRWPGHAAEEDLKEFLQADRQKGFALDEPPLLRLTLIRRGETPAWFVFTFHQLLLDTPALVVVLKEFFACYEALAAGREPELPRPRPYRDHIERLQVQDWPGAEKFWRQQLKGLAAPTRLPIGRTPGEAMEGLALRGELKLDLSEAALVRLAALVKAHRVTPNLLMQAAWALVLRGYSGTNDVVFGASRACRPDLKNDPEATVGLFMNIVPVRLRIDPEAELLPWLQELEEQWQEIRGHEQVPLARIQRWSELPPGQPLFETLFNFHESSLDESLRALGGKWPDRPIGVSSQPDFPLVVEAHGGRQPGITVVFDRRRFADSAIHRLLGHYRAVLEAFAHDPYQKLKYISLLTEGERQFLLVERNRTGTEYPRTQCVHQLFAAQAKKNPGRPAVAGAQEQLTYGELNRRSNQLAHRLRALGVGPEDLVGVCLDRGVDLVAAWLAILKAGAAFVPLDPAGPKERLAFQLQDCRSTVILTQRRWLQALPESPEKMTVLCLDAMDDLDCEPERNPEVATSPQNLACVIYVSGSNGQPKGVPIEHRSLANLVAWHRSAYQVTAQDRATQVVNPVFAASGWEVWPYLAAGASVHIPDETCLVPARLWSWLAENKITLTFLPTPLAEAAMAEARPAGLVLRALLTGGEKLNRRPPRDFPCPLFNHYGLTEGTVVVTSARVEPTGEKGVAPAIGRPIANMRVYVLDREGRPVPAGVPGELWIGGDGLAHGYLNRPALTAEKFIIDPFTTDAPARLYGTGDLVRWRPNGELEFLGRLDRQVKILGHRVELGEIEAVLHQHPAVRQAVVARREDARSSPLVACLVSEFKCTPEAGELRWFLSRHLPGHMVPSQFVWLKQLPLTARGKIDYQALLDSGRGIDYTAATFALLPTNEAALIKIWREVLGLQWVRIHDDFFKLGGDLLLAARVIARVRAAFKVQLPLRSLIEHPTIATFALQLDQAQRNPGPAVAPAVRRMIRCNIQNPRTQTGQPTVPIAN